MTSVFYEGAAVDIDAARKLGDGGEAVVYDIGGGTALKIYRQPDDPYYADITDRAQRLRDQQGARDRLHIMNEKLRSVPPAWSDRVVLPVAPVTDRGARKILGYGMRIVAGAQVLRQLSKRKSRPPGVTNDSVARIFRELHTAVASTHRAGVVIGDFNYFNVLVRLADLAPFVIDADSMQWGKFLCRTFNPKFVDPLICDPALNKLVQSAPHTGFTDWYAFALMLFECMMLTPLYGGVYEPTKGPPIELDARPLHRISVFHPEVTYPQAAVPLDALPDELLHFYTRLVTKDDRGEFPRRLIEGLRWTVCSRCAFEHARPHCPRCAQAAPAAAVREIVRGKVRVVRVFDTPGVILRAVVEGQEIKILYHHEEAFYRTAARYTPATRGFVSDHPTRVGEGELRPDMRFALLGHRTAIGLRSTVLVFDGSGGSPAPLTVDTAPGDIPVFAANSRHLYWSSNGELLRTPLDAPFSVGNVLEGGTQIWAGPRFGFGLSRAGRIQLAFVFDVERRGLNDRVALPPFRGQLLDVSCSFDEKRCWLFLTVNDGGVVRHFVHVITPDGSVTASAEGQEGDGGWVSSAGGRVAATLPSQSGGTIHCLFVATDRGIVRIHEDAGYLREAAQFPDSKGFVDSGHELMMGTDGIFTVDRREIRCVQLIP